MPPKKQVEEKKILLGRPGNNLKVRLLQVLARPITIFFFTRSNIT